MTATTCPACGGEPFPSKPDDETLGCQECGQEWPANEEVNMPEFPRMPDDDVRTIARFLGVDEDVVYAVLTFHRWFLTGRITPLLGSCAPRKDACPADKRHHSTPHKERG